MIEKTVCYHCWNVIKQVTYTGSGVPDIHHAVCDPCLKKEKDNCNMNYPNKAGWYWVRGKDHTWWTYLVHLIGEAPFLRVIEAWDRENRKVVFDRTANTFQVWGPELVEPPIATYSICPAIKPTQRLCKDITGDNNAK